MPEPPRRLPHRVRQAVLTAHIMTSIGLLGDSAGFLAVAIRAVRTDDSDVVVQLVQVLNMFSMFFGIPLSVGTLLSGLTLGWVPSGVCSAIRGSPQSFS